MAARKFTLLVLPVFVLSLLIILSSPVFSFPPTGAKSLARSETTTNPIYQEKFDHWRDEATDPGFNAWVQPRVGDLAIETRGADFGKAMSSREPIRIKVTAATTLFISAKQISPGGVGTVRIMNAYEPHDAYQAALIEARGVYEVPVQKVTGWEGDTSLWLEVWLEGKGRTLTLDKVVFSDPSQPQTAAAAPRGAAGKKARKKTVPSGPVLFLEDIHQGFEGWRSEETDPGFNTVLDLDKASARLRLAPNSRSGKLMSPAPGLRVDITPSTEFIINLGDLGQTRLKIELMEAQAPYATRQLLGWLSKPGKYSAKIADQTQWSGSKVFWIQIWQEATTNAEVPAGAAIKGLSIEDRSVRNAHINPPALQKN